MDGQKKAFSVKKLISKYKMYIIFVVVLAALFHGGMHFFFGGMWDEKYDVSMSPTYKPTVTVEGKIYELLPVFTNPEEALETFKKSMRGL